MVTNRCHTNNGFVHNSVNDTVRKSVKFDAPKSLSNNPARFRILFYLIDLCFEPVDKIKGYFGSGLSKVIIKGSFDIAFGSRT